jgi:hypothetical protein
MALCTVCSQLELKTKESSVVELGIYRDVYAKSKSLGPSQDGCGGCKFFCAAIRKEIKNERRVEIRKTLWSARMIIYTYLTGLMDVRLLRHSDVWCGDSLEIVTLDKEEPGSGMFA